MSFCRHIELFIILLVSFPQALFSTTTMLLSTILRHSSLLIISIYPFLSSSSTISAPLTTLTSFTQPTFISSTSNITTNNGHFKRNVGQDTIKIVLQAFTIIIFPIGMIGNILTIIIMRRKPFRASSACVYLPSIALYDILTLVTSVPNEWTTWYDIHYPTWLCRVHRFFNYSSGDVSVWLLVAFTMDRFVAVCFPFQKKLFCEPKKALLMVLVCNLLAVFKNGHLFWTRGYVEKKGRGKCTGLEEYEYFEKKVRPYLALIFVSVIPFVCILIFNSFIIHHLLKSNKSRPKSFSGKTISAANNSISAGEVHKTTKQEPVKKDKKSFYQTTAMCLSVSFAFLILYFPTIVVQICKSTEQSKQDNKAFENARNIVNMLPLVNHSINFYLYCLTGVRFRNELKMLCKHKQETSYSIFSGFNPRHSSQGPSIVMSDLHNSHEHKSTGPAITVAVDNKPSNN